ncbi:MAG: rod shape-determining protein MreC [Burkholderiaceae bacterium]|nr:rod shape-determining protein MreC [Burkholderiaceae bacterium]
MPLGTLDRTPPPFFRQGPSALTRVVFFASLAVFMMALDTRAGLTAPLRTALAVALHPVQQVVLAPVHALAGLSDYLGGIGTAREATQAAQARLAAQAAQALQAAQLQRENEQLRGLLGLRPRANVVSHAAQVVYDAADPYTRRVVIDRGSNHGLREGSPVIDPAGVLGQVTRLYPLSAEVTLLTDRDSAVPVLLPRSALRSIATGEPRRGVLELRFVAANADVQVGDRVETSGLDGVYPGGYPVGVVSRVDRRTKSDFAQIEVTPATPPDGARQVLVLDPLAPLPAAAASAPAPGASGTAARPTARGGSAP